jgi:hypothetical protein
LIKWLAALEVVKEILHCTRCRQRQACTFDSGSTEMRFLPIRQ